MSSMLRNLQRKIERRSPDRARVEQPYRQHADGTGYDVYHPTRGWRRISAKRVAAQARMASLLS
jgi:hypothetical protein